MNGKLRAKNLTGLKQELTASVNSMSPHNIDDHHKRRVNILTFIYKRVCQMIDGFGWFTGQITVTKSHKRRGLIPLAELAEGSVWRQSWPPQKNFIFGII
jgi:hypothetical protein